MKRQEEEKKRIEEENRRAVREQLASETLAKLTKPIMRQRIFTTLAVAVINL